VHFGGGVLFRHELRLKLGTHWAFDSNVCCSTECRVLANCMGTR